MPFLFLLVDSTFLSAFGVFCFFALDLDALAVWRLGAAFATAAGGFPFNSSAALMSVSVSGCFAAGSGKDASGFPAVEPASPTVLAVGGSTSEIVAAPEPLEDSVGGTVSAAVLPSEEVPVAADAVTVPVPFACKTS